MMPLARRLVFSLVAVALMLFASLACAQAAPPSSPPDLSALWPMIGLAVATGWGYGARWLTATKWIAAHNVVGHLLISLVGALVSGTTPVFQAGHVTGAALAWAAVGSLTTFFAGKNHPPTQEDLAAATARAAGQSGRALVAVLVAMAIAGVLGLGGALAMAGCATPGAVVLKNCELGALPAEEQSVLAEVGVVLMNPSAVLADLIALAAKLGPTQVGCAVAAWDAFLASRQAPPAGSKLMRATSDEQRAHALALTKAYLTAHPVACNHHYVAAVGGGNSL